MPVKILVVDGSASDRLSIKNKLKEYNILSAGSSMEAVRILKEHEIHLLILDINMHDMDGLLFPEISVKDRRLTKPRIIALTDNDNPDIAVKILNQGPWIISQNQ